MKFLRIRQVRQLTGLSRMMIYRLELAGNSPSAGNSARTLSRGWSTTSTLGQIPGRSGLCAERPGSPSGSESVRTSHPDLRRRMKCPT